MVRFYNWYSSWSTMLGSLWRTKRLVMVLATGQGLVEYALIVALVAVIVIGAVAFAGGKISMTLS